MAFAAMETHGLFYNEENLKSPFCHRTIYLVEPPNTSLKVDSVVELFSAVGRLVMGLEGSPWLPDSATLRKGIKDFLQNVKP
jgi:hypothetical protein